MGSRSRSRSPVSDQERSYGRREERERERSRHHHKSRHHKTSKGTSRDRSRERSVSKDRHRRERSRERSVSKDRHYKPSKGISRDRSRERSISKDRHRRERSKSRQRSGRHHSREDRHSRRREKDRSRHGRGHSSSEDDSRSKRRSHKERHTDKRSRRTSDHGSENESSERSNTTIKEKKFDTPVMPRKDEENIKSSSKDVKDSMDTKDKGQASNQGRRSEDKDVSDHKKVDPEKAKKDSAKKESKKKDEVEKIEKPVESTSSQSEKEKSEEVKKKDKKKKEESPDKKRREESPDKRKKEESVDKKKREESLDKKKKEESIDRSKKEESLDKKTKEEYIDKKKKEESSDKKKKEDIDKKKREESPDKKKKEESIEKKKKEENIDKKKKEENIEKKKKEESLDKKKKEENIEKKKMEENLDKKTDTPEPKEKKEKSSEKKIQESDKTDDEDEKSDNEKQEKQEKKKSSKRKGETDEQKKKHKKHKHKKHTSGSESENESADDATKKPNYDSDETTEQELLRKKKQLEEQLQIEEEIQQRTKIIKKEREAVRAKKLKSSINSEVIKPAEKEKEQSPQTRSQSHSPSRTDEHKQTRDDRTGKRSNDYSSDEAEEPQIGARYWGGDSSKETSQSQKSKQLKTSDTYWNKYADKLGIQIEDPRNSDPDWEKKKDKDRDRKEDKRKESSPERPSRSEESSRKDNKRKGEPSERENINTSNKVSNPPARDLIKKPVMDPLTTKTGGAYIPPARLKMMQAQITDKGSQMFQRLAWEALKKSINGLVNKVNVSNIGIIVRELMKENVIRGRGVLCRALMQAQAFSQTFTHVYAALVAIINSKFPQIGELLLKRLVIQLRRGVKKNDKNVCMSCCRFIAHLVNQQVAHEVVALEILTFLLERAKDFTTESEVAEKSRNNSCELAILFITECGEKLNEVSPRGMKIILETFRNILHEGKLELRVSYMLEVIFAVVKDGFKDHPAVSEELDLVEEDEQFTHIVELDGKLDAQDILNVFKFDPEYEDTEEKYKEICSGILGDDSDGSESEGGSESDDEASEDEDEKKEAEMIIDQTETNMVAFRRVVYLTIQSSLDVDECAHKLLKGEIKPGWEAELCNMILDCCAQQRTYIKFYGLLAQRFCMINKVYQEPFQQIFKDAYDTCHRLETEKLRNVTRLFAHLLFSDAVSWDVLSHVHLNEDETTSSSRVFIKILFQVSLWSRNTILFIPMLLSKQNYLHESMH